MRIIIAILLVGIAAAIAIHSALMRKIIAILLVGIALFYLLMPWLKWDGRATRDVKISVKTANQTPVPGARVVFLDRYGSIMQKIDYAQMTPAEKQEWMALHRHSGVTDAEGCFAFRCVFPAGGSKFLIWYTGKFGLTGTVTVEADGYQTLERPLRELVGRETLSIRSHRKNPIAVECTLEAVEKLTPSK
ncbi:MAG: carboxypeptidase regulatory-like domain-containing protein [Lentisphaerae bacterium]|nr:carboxypeptidase regulatory-like domain-containing protein [Lentisphaerota bacterium]